MIKQPLLQRPGFQTAAFTVVALAAIIAIPVIWGTSKRNEELRLRTTFNGQQSRVSNYYQNTWTTIQQTAEISSQYKETFLKVYPALMEGRYGNSHGGALASFIQESNPTFDTSLYNRLARVVEVKRAELLNEENKLTDLKNEHDYLVGSFPANIFLSGAPKLVPHYITSRKTEKVFTDGENEKDLKLF